MQFALFRRTLRFAVLGIGLTVGAASGAVSPLDFSPQQVFAMLQQRIEAKQALGLSVALLGRDGQVTFVSAGTSGNPQRTAVDADTIFEIGSVTKSFTGTVLAQMVHAGTVDLGTTVSMLAPAGAQFAANGAGGITLEALATHRSGLPRLPLSWDFAYSWAQDLSNPYKHYSADSFWRYMYQYEGGDSGPHAVSYSNLGYGLLGMLLARQAGADYPQLIFRAILQPLGMTDTSVQVVATALPRFARGHSVGLAPASHWDLSAFEAAGALRSTARDMASYMKAQQSGALLGSRAAQAPRAVLDARRSVGLGWLTQSNGADSIVWHNGGTGGFRSFVGFSQTTGRGVVVLSNTAADVDDLGMHLLDPSSPLSTPKGIATWGISALVSFVVLLVVMLGLGRARPFVGLESVAQAPKVSRAMRWLPRPVSVPTLNDAAWRLFDTATVLLLLALFAPWRSVPWPLALVGAMVPVVASLIFAWRVRHLPWVRQGQGPKRKWQWVARALQVALFSWALYAFV